jgi:hypothetical protein
VDGWTTSIKNFLKTRWQFVVIAIFAILFLWGVVREAEAAEHSAEIGLSYGVINSEKLITQRIGYVYDDRWRLRLERHGGDYYDTSNSYTLARSVMWRKGKTFQPMLEFGVTYWDELLIDPNSRRGLPFVNDEWTYSLGVGVRAWDVFEAGLTHSSTAGRSRPNRGIDRIYISYVLDLP